LRDGRDMAMVLFCFSFEEWVELGKITQRKGRKATGKERHLKGFHGPHKRGTEI